jgi:hypothetical protein
LSTKKQEVVRPIGHSLDFRNQKRVYQALRKRFYKQRLGILPEQSDVQQQTNPSWYR